MRPRSRTLRRRRPAGSTPLRGLGNFERSESRGMAQPRGKFLLNAPERSDRGQGVRLRVRERLQAIGGFPGKEFVQAIGHGSSGTVVWGGCEERR